MNIPMDDRTDIFIASLEKGNGTFLDELEDKAIGDGVPIIKKPVQGLLRVLLKLKRPANVLEIGTAVAFSSILMATYGPEDMRIVTIEDYEKRVPLARENIKKAGFEEKIEVIFKDANEVLPEMEPGFDLIFIDAAKAQYINYLPEALRLLNNGGIMLADNCLQGGDILESKFIVERRDRTIHKRMREFLYAVENDDRLTTTILTIGDGVALSVKNEK